MTLTGPVVLAVLFGALLHASWNALIKSASDKELDTALIHSLGLLLALPLLLLVTGLPVAAAWPYIAASSVIHVGYYIALAGAYRHGDLGLTYPVMRGCAPLLVALGSHSLLGESLSLLAWAGVAAICSGVLLLGLSRASASAPAGRARALRFALLNAAIIAAYTVIDGLGVRAAGDAGAYVAALFLFDGIPYLLVVLWQRGPAGRRAALAYMAGRWRIASLGTVASLGSYAIALWAMTRAPVALVAALREVSVLFAALLGTLWLREPFGAGKAVGVCTILAGIMALRFG